MATFGLQAIRNVTVNFTGAPMPIDAYKAVMKRVEELEFNYFQDPNSVADVSAVVSVLTGNTPYQVYVFNFTLVKATGTYTFAYIETAPNADSSIQVTSIDVTPATVTLAVGATQQLSVAYAPTNASQKAVSYVSSVPAKATVSSTGLITAVASGTTTITITSANGKTDTVAVTVS